MTDNFSETKWNTFASTGKITDYLEFKDTFSKPFGGKTCGIAGTTQTAGQPPRACRECG